MIRILALLLVSCIHTNAQTIRVVNPSYKTSIRGLSVVDNKCIWVSGSNGTVGRSTNGGRSWQWITVPGMEKRDFRDVEAFSDNIAVIMAVDEPAVILRSEDGGANWQTVFSDTRKGMFLDAMSFDGMKGSVIGDPIEGKMFMAETSDGGKTWNPVTSDNLSVQTGEACFASSGTNIINRGSAGFVAVTGGTAARLLSREPAKLLPMIQGRASTGTNSIARSSSGPDLLVVAGGDFAEPASSEKTMFYSSDNGSTWQSPLQPPKGYKSCVAFISDRLLITCGTSGVDISSDRAVNWKHISDESYHVVQKAKKGKVVVLAGSNGRVAVLERP